MKAHRAHVEAGGVVGGAHRGEATVEDEGGGVLCLVDDEQGVGGGPFGFGLG